MRKRYHERKAAHRCIDCNMTLDESWKMVYCAACNETRRQRSKKPRQMKILALRVAATIMPAMSTIIASSLENST
jgi:Zn finger protein HypA/HybF involved in hydrogenase expression